MINNMYRRTQEYINLQQQRLAQEKLSLIQRVLLRGKLFLFYLIHSVLHSLALLFTPADRCFVLANNPNPNGTWSQSYYQHLLFQRRLRLYSTSSFFAIVIASASIALAFNILFPPTEIKIVQAAGNTCTVTNLNNDGAGSLRDCLAIITNGDIVDLTGAPDGTINLTTSLVLEDDQIIINGNSSIILDGSGIAGSSPALLVSGNTNTINYININNAPIGINITGSNNTLANVAVTSSQENGIDVAGAQNTTINDTQVNNNGGHGLRLFSDASQTVIDSSNFTSNVLIGIYSPATTNLIIRDCTVSGNSYGVSLEASSVEIDGGTFYDSTNNGVRAIDSSGTIADATIRNNQSAGLILGGSSFTVSSNTIQDNQGAGLTLDSVTSSNFTQNIIQSNLSNGLEVINQSSQNEITSNTIINNSDYGIDLTGSTVDSNTIDDNTISGNLGGLKIASSPQNTIISNIISGNGSEGGIRIIGSEAKYNLLSQNQIREYPNTPIILESEANEGISPVISAQAYYSSADNFYVSGIAPSSGQVEIFCSGNFSGDLDEYLNQATVAADNSFNYSASVDVSQCTNISLVYIDSSNNTSTIYSASLTLDDAAPTVTADPAGEDYSVSQSVILTATDTYDPAPVIYYTIDGTDPTASSTLYSQAISISQDTTLKFLAVDFVNNTSAVSTEEYTFGEEEEEGDTTAPVISQIQAVNITQEGALITWSTDEASTSRVRYGLSADNLNQTANDSSLVTDHSLQLSDLTEDTRYYYQVSSADAAGNRSTAAVKNFVTLAVAPIIISPEEGAIIYLNQRLDVLGTGTPSNLIKLYLNGSYQDQDKVDADGNWQTQTKKSLVPNSHNLRAKDATENVNSQVVHVIRATQEVTDRVRINISNEDLRKLPAAEQLNTVYPGQPILYGLCTKGEVAKVFIDGVYNGQATLAATDNPAIAEFEYQPFLHLDPGTYEISLKVYQGQTLIEEGPVRTINVYGHPAPTILSYNNQTKVVSGLAYPGSWVSIYIDQIYQGTIQVSAGSSQAAGFVWNVSDLANGQHTFKAQASHLQTGPYSRFSNVLQFRKYALGGAVPVPADDAPAVPEVDDPSEPEVDTDQDGVKDEDEEYLGTDPKDPADGDQAKEEYKEKIIEIKEKEYQNIVKDQDKPDVYAPISDLEVDLTPAAKEKLIKDLNTKAEEQTVLSVTTNGQKQSLASGDTGVVYSTLDVRDAFWAVLTGREPADKNDNNITLHGRLPVVAGAAPGYAVVTLFSNPIVKIAQAQENGEWTLSVPVDYLPEGEHTAFLQTEVNGVTSDQIEIARFVIQEKQRFSNTTIFFLFNIGLAILALLFAITLQLRKNRKLIEEMKKQESRQAS